jgi:hypothetical protein
MGTNLDENKPTKSGKEEKQNGKWNNGEKKPSVHMKIFGPMKEDKEEEED